MSHRRLVQRATATFAFLSAAISFALGLGGQSGSWLVTMLISLVLLTIGFFLASDPSHRHSDVEAARH